METKELIERLTTFFSEMAPEVAQVMNVIERWPLTSKDVEIYAWFSEDTALHGDSLRSFLKEAIKAKKDGKF